MSLGRLVDVHCDGCGAHTRPFDNAKSARAHARILGWHRISTRRLDLCPRCFATRPLATQPTDTTETR